MTDNKARRVCLSKAIEPSELYGCPIESPVEIVWDAPTVGDHHLAPVDEYEVVKKEVWERVMDSLLKISCIERRRNPHFGMVRESGIEKECIVCIAELALRALAELTEDNKARRVSLPEYPEGFFAGREDPNGDHMLVPVEKWERLMSVLRTVYSVSMEEFGWDIATTGGEDE